MFYMYRNRSPYDNTLSLFVPFSLVEWGGGGGGGGNIPEH